MIERLIAISLLFSLESNICIDDCRYLQEAPILPLKLPPDNLFTCTVGRNRSQARCVLVFGYSNFILYYNTFFKFPRRSHNILLNVTSESAAFAFLQGLLSEFSGG